MTVTSDAATLAPVSKRTVASGALWIAATGLLLRVASIAVTAVVAHIMSPDDFGVFAVASAVFVVVGSLADLGMGAAIVRATEDESEIAPTVAGLAIGLAGGLALLMFVSASELAKALGEPSASSALRILSGCLALNGLVVVPTAQLTREFRQRRLFFANVLSFAPANLVLFLFARHGDGADAFAWSRVVGQVVAGFVVISGGQRLYRPTFRTTHLRRLLAFGIPISFANVVNWTLLNADYLVVAHALSATDVGAYMLAFTIASWPTVVLGSVLNGVVIPAMARLESSAARGDAIVVAARLVSLCALPVGFLVLALARPVVLAVYGDQWHAAVPVLEVLAVYGMTFAYCLLAANVLVALGRSWRLLAIQAVWLGLLVPIMFWFLARIGLVGVGWAHVVVIGLVLPLYLLALFPELRGHRGALLRAVTPVLGAAGGAGLVAWSVARFTHGTWAGLLAGGALGGIAYLLMMAPTICIYLPERVTLRLRAALRLRHIIW